MQNILLSLVLNGLMAGLLLATIIYCLRLNGRIKLLQDSKSELARIVREFDESTQRATQSIAEIHQATSRLSDNIQHKIDKANFLVNDLDTLIERGQKVTGSNVGGPARPTYTAPRAETPAPVRETPRPAAPRATIEDVTPAPAPAAASAEAGTRRPLRMRSRAEQELMNVLGNKTGE